MSPWVDLVDRLRVDLSRSGNMGIGVKASCDFAVAFMRLHETYLRARYDLQDFPDDSTDVIFHQYHAAVIVEGSSAMAGITCRTARIPFSLVLEFITAVVVGT
jgi:hypothetical protein